MDTKILKSLVNQNTMWIGISLISAVMLFGCEDEKEKKAVVVLNPTEGYQVRGVVTFTETHKGVKIVADVQGLTPGKHGFHIHEKGDCGSADASSAGGHFNPDNKKHGSPDSLERHVGDLGNLEADEQGKAHYERVDAIITLEGDHSVIGRSLIIHEKEDDFTSQPVGNAGARVACGLIVEATEK